MAQVAVDDDSVHRFVVMIYRYDSTRRERRKQPVMAFDNTEEFERYIREANEDLRIKKLSGEVHDPAEEFSGHVRPPGFDAERRAARDIRRAVHRTAPPP